MTGQVEDSQAQPLLSPGDWVEHFEILRLIGRGGMGEVYLAKDTRLSRRVALKVVRAKSFGDSRALERFLYEAKVTARFNHPHIVTAYSVGEHEGHPYVALEYLEGETLRQRIDRGRVSLREALRSALAIAEALEEAHRHKILHRDLKPENVVIPEDQRLRVLDFGLAKVLASPELSLAATQEGSSSTTQDSILREPDQTHDQGFTGTPYYMAPEQWQSEPSTEATDIWGLGVILFEMLVGERPFQGNTIFLLGSRVIAEDLSPTLPAEPPEGDDPERWELTAAIVARCMSKTPEARPSARELARELRDLLERGPRRGARRAPGGRRRWVIAALIAALALGLLAFGLVVAFSPPADTGPGDAGSARRSVSEAGRPALTGPIFGPRMASARPIVRIGATDLLRLRGSEFSPAVFWGLLHSEPDGEVLPVLVERRPSLSNGLARPADSGGFEVTWRLRPGLRWSDGQPLTVEDLLFALAVHDEPHITEVRRRDERTVVVTWDDQMAEALESIRPLPRHVLQSVFERGGVEAVIDHLRMHPTPVVGPYQVTEFRPEERLVLRANPHFIGTPPAIERVEVVRADPEELVRLYEAQTIDLIMPDALFLHQAQELLRRRPGAVHIRPSNAMYLLQPDLSLPILERPEVRRAIVQAIDRRRLVNEVFGSEGSIADAPTTAATLPPGVSHYEHDDEAARAVLATRLEGARPTSIALIHGGDETEQRIAALLVLDLEAVGLRVVRRQVGDAELRRLSNQCRFGGLLLRSIRISPRQSVLSHLNLPRVGEGYDLSVRHSGYTEAMAALVARERRAVYGERREQLRDSLWGLYSQRLPTLPLAFAAERVVVHPLLRGWEVRPGDRFGRGLEKWYFLRQDEGAGRDERSSRTDDLDD